MTPLFFFFFSKQWHALQKEGDSWWEEMEALLQEYEAKKALFEARLSSIEKMEVSFDAAIEETEGRSPADEDNGPD